MFNKELLLQNIINVAKITLKWSSYSNDITIKGYPFGYNLDLSIKNKIFEQTFHKDGSSYNTLILNFEVPLVYVSSENVHEYAPYPNILLEVEPFETQGSWFNYFEPNKMFPDTHAKDWAAQNVIVFGDAQLTITETP